METHVEFRSTLVSSVQELATVLFEQLKQEGVQVRDPFSEDWGWTIPICNDAFPIWIGCGQCKEYVDGFLCFIEPRKPYVRKFLFKKISTTQTVETIQKALSKVLAQNEEIYNIKWWTEYDFNHPNI
ncbi:hypothetical protein [Sulfurimonas diazotrophicus]|uniref:DUF3788 family protein n=1 Tax=Sulfurimonas diazotrophicus TaxID=3131939 RepID=A0ABZ3HCA3_9BACT